MNVARLEERAHAGEAELEADTAIEADIGFGFVLAIELSPEIVHAKAAGKVRLHADTSHANDRVDGAADDTIIDIVEKDVLLATEAVIGQISAQLHRQRNHAEPEHHLAMKSVLDEVLVFTGRQRQSTGDAEANGAL